MKRSESYERWYRSILILIVVGFILCLVALFTFLVVQKKYLTLERMDEQKMGIVFVFEDEPTEMLFMQIAFWNTKNNKMIFWDLPIELNLVLEDIRLLKDIYRERGPQEFRLYLSDWLEFPFPVLIQIKRQNLSEMIDLMGGLDLNIAYSVNDRRIEDEKVEYDFIPAGKQMLDGEKATEYLFYPFAYEDIFEKSYHVFSFMRSFLLKLREFEPFLAQKKILEMVKKRLGFFSTRYPLAAFLHFLVQADIESSFIKIVLGQERVIDERKIFFAFGLNTLPSQLQEISNTLEKEEWFVKKEEKIRVEVLNGVNVTGLAQKFANTLAVDTSFMISRIANAPHQQYNKTILINRNASISALERISNLTGCRYGISGTYDKMDQESDIIVILGSDFDGKFCTT